MFKKITLHLIIFLAITQAQANTSENRTLNFAVEYTSHATSFYYAEAKDLFANENLNVNDVKVYVSGAAVATAFVKEHFDVAYMCLVPAIITYANGGVPIKIIAGTHLDGYGVVANSKKIKSLKDLENEGVKIGVGAMGTVSSFIQEVIIEKANLDPNKARKNFVQMNSSKQIMALKAGIVDAIVLPEHFVSLAASLDGMEILANSSELWKDLQGSVIVVSEKMLNESPEIVEKIKKVNREAIDAINADNTEASVIVAQNLNIHQDRIKHQTKSPDIDLTVTPQIAKSSIENLILTDTILPEAVQEVIDKMFQYGFIQNSFDASEILAIN